MADVTARDRCVDDGTSKGSLPYVKVGSIHLAREYHPTPCSSKAQNRRAKHLQSMNKTLNTNIRVLLFLLFLMMGLLLLLVETQDRFCLWNADSLSGCGAQEAKSSPVSMANETCETITSRFEGCQDSEEGGCVLDVKTALCLLVKAKGVIDARTKKLDDEVYQSKNKLLSVTRSQGRRSLWDAVSVTYLTRPSVHMYLYYSQEVASEKRSHYEQLTWAGKASLSTRRHFDVTLDSAGNISGIKPTHPGYYYVYSQVTFRARDTDKPNWTKPRPLHCVYKSNSGSRRRLGCGQAMLMSYDAANNKVRTSFLQGIFLLTVNDTLSVTVDGTLLDTEHWARTFFGAYQI